MGRLLLAAALATGCYAPAANTGAPCGPGGSCPTGQECRGGTCFAEDAAHDAAVSILDDAALDSTMITVDAAPDAPSYIPWGVPDEIMSLETTANNETDPSITANRLTVVLTGNVGTGDDDIFIGSRTSTSTPFTNVDVIPGLNLPDVLDRGPEISPDGKTLYFVSNRSGNYDVYMSTYTTSWSAPVLRDDLSTAGNESGMAVSPDGLTAVVFDDDDNELIFYSRATLTDDFASATRYAVLHISSDIAAPTITNGGAIIYFHAFQPRRLYRATKQGNTYTTPELVTELNVAGTRTATPHISQNDNVMVYEVEGDIYEVTR